jgi:hypothetical protein
VTAQRAAEYAAVAAAAVTAYLTVPRRSRWVLWILSGIAAVAVTLWVPSADPGVQAAVWAAGSAAAWVVVAAVAGWSRARQRRRVPRVSGAYPGPARPGRRHPGGDGPAAGIPAGRRPPGTPRIQAGNSQQRQQRKGAPR